MFYAVNIGDMATVSHGNSSGRVAVAVLIGPVQGVTVDAEPGRVDGMALTLACDEERGRAIVDVIRLKYKRHEFRCYQSATGAGGWARI